MNSTRKMAVKNKQFEKGHRATGKQTEVSIEALLSSDEIKVSIAEFVIFMRLSILLTNYMFGDIDPKVSIERQRVYHSQLLIKKISNLPFCKIENWQESAIKRPIQLLLDTLSLSKQKNDEWALQYLAHFFSTHTIYQLFYYKDPFFVVEEKAYHAIKETRLKHTRQKLQKQIDLLLSIGVPKEIIKVYDFQSLFVLFIPFINFFTMYVSGFLFPILEQPIIFNIFLSIGIWLMGAPLINKLMPSLISWKIAGQKVQIGLIEEIDNAVFSHSLSHKIKKLPYHKIESDIQFPELISTPVTAPPAPRPTVSSFANNDNTPQDNEHKSKEKRKNKSTTSQLLSSLSKNILRVKLTWEDSTIPPLHGIVKMKNNAPAADIDFILAPGISRGWSMQPSINAWCNHHFFFQKDSDNSDDIADEFSKIISLAHVVPPTAHAGLVPIQSNDSEFPNARYKGKSFSKEAAAAVWRVGLFPLVYSKSIEIEFEEGEDSKQQLPESLKNKKFLLHKPGSPKRTH